MGVDIETAVFSVGLFLFYYATSVVRPDHKKGGGGGGPPSRRYHNTRHELQGCGHALAGPGPSKKNHKKRQAKAAEKNRHRNIPRGDGEGSWELRRYRYVGSIGGQVRKARRWPEGPLKKIGPKGAIS